MAFSHVAKVASDPPLETPLGFASVQSSLQLQQKERKAVSGRRTWVSLALLLDLRGSDLSRVTHRAAGREFRRGMFPAGKNS